MGDSNPETISADEARELMARGEARVLDARPFDEIEDGHAPGAIETDPDDLDTAISRATRDSAEVKMLVMSGDDERSGSIAAEIAERGHPAAVIEGGFDAWAESGLPLQPGSPEYEGPDLAQPGAPSGTEPSDEEAEAAADETEVEGSGEAQASAGTDSEESG